MSTFKSNNDIVQSFAYGFGLNLTNREKNNWRASVLFSQLRGPDDIKVRSMDGQLSMNLMSAKFTYLLDWD